MPFPTSSLNGPSETAGRIRISPPETAQCPVSLIKNFSSIQFRNLSRGILRIERVRYLVRQTVLLSLAAAFAAPLVTGCASITLLSDKEIQEALSTNVKRNTLEELDPQISDYFRKSYSDRFVNPNLTYVSDVLLDNLVARTKGPAFSVAVFWNVSEILDCRFPSLTKSILDQLSHQDRYLILLTHSYVNSSLRIQEKLIVVHEVFHFIQYERDQFLYKWDCSQPSTLEEYIKQPFEQESYMAEMRYAQTSLKMTWEQYFYNRFGMAIFANAYFRKTLSCLWDKVQGKKGKAAKKSSSAKMCLLLTSV